MKKAMTMALTATLATSAITAPLAFAQDKKEPTSNEVQEEVATNFIQLTGKLGKIEKHDNGTLYTTIEQGDETFSLYIEESTLVLDNQGKEAELKEGAKFTAFVDKNKPMLAIYPPRYTPEVLVVETADFGIVEVGTFDKDFVNKENTLKLNLSDETVVTNVAGDKLSHDAIVGKEAIVLYGPATFSIPAQTNPYRVIVFDGAQDGVEEITPIEEVVDFQQFEGEITDVVTRENGSQLLVIEDKEQPFALTVDKETIVLDNTGKKIELQKGMKFTAYVDVMKPAILIYPPQYAPEVIIVQTEGAGVAEFGTFDLNLLNHENTLKLTIDDKTEITGLTGDKLAKDDLINAQALVFYTVATASIPAQTTPTKVIVFGEATFPEAELAVENSKQVDGVTMVPLRALAEELGYKVTSTGKGAILTKGNASYEITRGQKQYTHNRAIKAFDVAPTLLEENTTYVPQTFIESLRGE